MATNAVEDHDWRSAASTAVMQSGRHFAQFTVVQGGEMMFGLILPGWDVLGGDAARGGADGARRPHRHAA